MQGFYRFQQIKTLFQIMNATEDLFCVHTSKKTLLRICICICISYKLQKPCIWTGCYNLMKNTISNSSSKAIRWKSPVNSQCWTGPLLLLFSFNVTFSLVYKTTLWLLTDMGFDRLWHTVFLFCKISERESKTNTTVTEDWVWEERNSPLSDVFSGLRKSFLNRATLFL